MRLHAGFTRAAPGHEHNLQSMAKRIHATYEWEGPPERQVLRQTGTISDAKLRAWEYYGSDANWTFNSGAFHDTVRVWVTARPDLRIPERILVGDAEEKVMKLGE